MSGPGASAAGDRSVAGGGDVGAVATGDGALAVHQAIANATVLPPEALVSAADIDCPPGLRNLPARPALFVGREGELDALDAALAGSGGVVVQALHGLGGIGKSTLAAHWAATRAGHRNPVWWISADSAEGVAAGLAGLGGALQPMLGGGVVPQEILQERAEQWLAAHEGWVVVLDNVTNPAHVKPLLARVPQGRFLITSRRATGWHGVADPIGLGVLELPEAVELFRRIHPAGDPDGTPELCAELGCLPLAVEQAAAYCAETGIGPRAYLGLLADFPADLYAAAPEGGDAERTVARVWRLTLDLLAESGPLPGRILRMLAWCAPDGIPRALLDPLGRPPEVHRAVGRLRAHNMVTVDGDRLSVHRLVQAVARTVDPEDPYRTAEFVAVARDDVVAALSGLLPADVDDQSGWPAVLGLLPHAEALVRYATEEEDAPAVSGLLAQIGERLRAQGAGRRARPLLERAERGFVRHGGSEHPDTLAARNLLAWCLRASGEPEAAYSLAEGNLADALRTLGRDHVATLDARSQLAVACLASGRPQQGLPLGEENLAERIRVLGAEDLSVHKGRVTLGALHMGMGQVAEALGCMEAAVPGLRAGLGAEHSATREAALLHDNLSRVCELFAAGAELDSFVALADADPHAEATRDSLKAMGTTMGRAMAASAERTRELLDSELRGLQESSVALGERHPEVLWARMRIMSLYAQTGELECAVEVGEPLLADCVQEMGAEDVFTGAVTVFLSLLYEGLSRPDLAEDLLERHSLTAERAERMLGMFLGGFDGLRSLLNDEPDDEPL
ncbi:tetratricopeptide repeat protein [Streptomyces sp. NPDC059009]|uniref:tetratricopeptide repeat protein n=1 Tax=Streptomyces sp. NPDC059009 TaxID=3346694 RepID=UPI0036CF2F7A